MNTIAKILIATFFIFSVAHAGPIEGKKKSILDESDIIYTGKHDIVKIYTSLALMEELQQRIVFFIEADINNDGRKVDKGLYVIIDNSTTKLLDSGKDISGDVTGKVYFATKDGIYTYNRKKNNAYKYGNMGESIVSLAVENNTGVVYALTENHVLYKITENGKKSDVDDRVKHAQEIVLDMFDNLYYYDENKKLFVVVGQDTKEVYGLPNNPTSLTLIKPFNGMEGIFVLANNEPYTVFSNCTSIKTESATLKQINLTAYSYDATVLIYFGHEKKIYEYNLVAKILTSVFERISESIKEKVTNFFA